MMAMQDMSTQDVERIRQRNASRDFNIKPGLSPSPMGSQTYEAAMEQLRVALLNWLKA
jgi:hypothetical protein